MDNRIVILLALAGGLFAVLTFIHFFVDWIFQSHSEAMVKHNNPNIRAKHCLIYTLGFLPFMWLCEFTFWEYVISTNVLFWSHFYLDTYHGVFLWAKYIRRPPEMVEPWKETYLREDGSIAFRVHPPNAIKGFVEFIQTALGKILMITLDQISHLIFLWVLVYFAIQHL
jgi:hypothetical protein